MHPNSAGTQSPGGVLWSEQILPEQFLCVSTAGTLEAGQPSLSWEQQGVQAWEEEGQEVSRVGTGRTLGWCGEPPREASVQA